MKSLVMVALMLVAVCAVLSQAKPAPEPIAEDLDTAASHHGGIGYVKIKVYRGPGEKDAPFGYWVKQPHDDHRHGKD
ncbi:hypothetical protein B566_EDAN005441 [Ephemera danica]|nr:hypothetical protein B566_EDAN005441 [Ephemera danica]